MESGYLPAIDWTLLTLFLPLLLASSCETGLRGTLRYFSNVVGTHLGPAVEAVRTRREGNISCLGLLSTALSGHVEAFVGETFGRLRLPATRGWEGNSTISCARIVSPSICDVLLLPDYLTAL